jgi:hypothetical protein
VTIYASVRHSSQSLRPGSNSPARLSFVGRKIHLPFAVGHLVEILFVRSADPECPASAFCRNIVTFRFMVDGSSRMKK